MTAHARSRVLLPLVLTVVLGAVLTGLAPVATAGKPGLVGSVAIAGGADAVAVTGNVIVTTSTSARTVTVVDASTLTVRSTTPVPLIPTEVVLSPDGSLAYVLAIKPSPLFNSNDIYVLDTATGAVLRSASYQAVNGKSCIGSMTLRDLTISQDGRRLDVVASGCGSNVEIWTLDPQTLAVGEQIVLLSGFLVGSGSPTGSMVSFDNRLMTFLYVQVFKCPDVNGCPEPDRLLSLPDTTPGGLSNGPVEMGVTLARDPVDGKMWAPTPTTAWISYSGVPAPQSLIRFDPITGAQELRVDAIGTRVGDLQVDAAARRLYAMRSPSQRTDPDWVPLSDSMTVVSLTSGKVLGDLPMVEDRGFAVGNGRVYVATAAGLDVIDPSQALAPSAPQSLKMKISPAGKGKVRATISFKPPVATGTSPITGYRVDAYASDYGNSARSVRGTATCRTRKTTCTVTLKKVTTEDDLIPAMYVVTVRAVNANGLGGASELSVEAK